MRSCIVHGKSMKNNESGLSLLHRKYSDMLVPYLFVLPFIISFFAFFVYPSIYSFILSFYSYKGYGAAKFIGFDNYVALFNYGLFWSSIKNTFFYFIAHMIPLMIISFSLAVILYYGFASRVSRVYKAVVFLPQVITIVASALSWKVILATQHGVINHLLGTNIGFLEAPGILKWSVVILILWRASGWYMVIYMAGLTNIGEEIIDSTKIDGTSTMQRLLYIIIPMMKPIFLFTFLIDAINSLKIFTEPYLLFGSGGEPLSPQAEPILGVLVGRLNAGNFGMAAAVGWVLFFITVIIISLQYTIFRERNPENG